MSDDTEMTDEVSFVAPLSRQYTFYINDIGGPEDYIHQFEQIRHAEPNDVIKFHINSAGGNGFTAVQFLRAMAETKATTIASVEGQCASAATMIFLSAKVQEITPHSIFVFHNYSGSAEGKGGDMLDQIGHMQQWATEMIRDVYKYFLTEEEIKIIIDGKDLYMNSKEVESRLVKRNEMLKAEREAPKKKGRKKNV